ncbi:MAG: efflux RND transporter permease subunit, partial [Blastocatellia bacterium]
FGLRDGLILDVSPLSFVEQGSRERADFEAARKEFGPDDYLVIALVCDDVFAPANLERLQALHNRIAKIQGVAEILSLINVPYARGEGDQVSSEKLLPKSFDDTPRLTEARRIGTADRLYVGNLVSADARTAAINILYKPEVPTRVRHALTNQIYQTARGAGFIETYFAGDPFSQWRATEAVKNDLTIFLPLTLLLVAFVLWLCFRSIMAVILPMATIGIGLIWLFGLMGYLSTHFTILGLMLPTLMLAIGCSYIIHVINQVAIAECGMRNAECGSLNAPAISSQQSTNDNPQSAIRNPHSAIEEALRFIALPVIVSALTIIAGFLSLAFTPIPAIRTTGILAAVGAAFTCLLSLTFIPAALAVSGRRAAAFRVGLGGKMVKLLEDLGRWATSRQTLLYVLTVVLVVFSIAGVRRIVIDVDFFHFFKPNSETSIGLAEINKRLSGAISFELIVEGRREGALESPDLLRRIEALQSFAEQQSANGQRIDRALSVVDFIKHINRAFHDNDPRGYTIPSDEKLIRELFQERDQLRGFLSEDGRRARILIRSNLYGSQAMAVVIRNLVGKGQELLPDCRVYATGTFVLLNRTSDLIAGEQVRSITIALVTIFLMLALLFRSPRVGFTALVPNLIPVLFFFGFMGWRRIPLNLTTSLVASVVLGLAVDNAVQFIVRFRRVQAVKPELREAIIESMRLSGRPIIYANVALAATFAIFAISNFEPIGSFGLLSAVTIIGCLIEDLVLLPARLTSPVFKAR